MAQQDDTAYKCKVPILTLFYRGFHQQTLKVPVPSIGTNKELIWPATPLELVPAEQRIRIVLG